MKGFDLQMEIMLVLIIAIFTAIFFTCIFEWTINSSKCAGIKLFTLWVSVYSQ